MLSIDQASGSRFAHHRWQFILAFVAALMIHIIMGLIVRLESSPAISPEKEFYSLDIKLGGAQAMPEKITPPVASAPTAPKKTDDSKQLLEAALPAEAAKKTAKQPSKKPRVSPAGGKPALAMKHTKQQRGQVAERYQKRITKKKPQQAAPGHMLGNTTDQAAQMVANYPQTISLWVNKFKIYPQQAKAAGMQGRAVVRIRIDEKGNIHYRLLTQRTPFPMLDKAALDMARRADPVPPIPAGYPTQGGFAEFEIAVNYTLD